VLVLGRFTDERKAVLDEVRLDEVRLAEVSPAEVSPAEVRLAEVRPGDWANQVEVQRLAAAGILAHVRGDDEKAVALVRAAADLDATMDKHPATPSSVLPARELLAELNQPAAALVEYRAMLSTDPNRFRSLLGEAAFLPFRSVLPRALSFSSHMTWFECPFWILSSCSRNRPRFIGTGIMLLLFAFVIWLESAKGTQGDNRFGPDPIYPQRGHVNHPEGCQTPQNSSSARLPCYCPARQALASLD
jgi:hypothetical protein